MSLPTPADEAAPRRQRSPQEEVKAARAYYDYSMAGKDRSVDGLWRDYVRRNREGEEVATTTRAKLYQWSREDAWPARIAQEEAQRLQAEKAAFLRQRKHQLHALQALLPQVNTALVELLVCDDAAVRLRTVTAILDRLGFVPESRSTAAARRLGEEGEENGPEPATTPFPPEGASEAEVLEWLNRQH